MTYVALIILLLAAIAAAAVLLHRMLRRRRAKALMQIRSIRGIAEEGFVRIGGIDQWIGIRGEDWNNPVVLLIHGGPGASSSIFKPLIRSWERHFTVVQWDQRGSGKTLGRTGKKCTGGLAMGTLVQDGIEVCEYVRHRLRKDRLILVASSLGSTFGLSMVRRHPDIFHAYIGTDQNVGMLRGQKANHEATLARLKALKLRKGVAALERIGPDPGRWSARDYSVVAKWTMRSDRATYSATMKLLKSAIWFSPAHSLRDIRDFLSGMEFSLDQLFPEIRRYDAWQEGTQFDVPFFIFQGERDVLTPTSLAQAYFDDVVAPAKGFVVIPKAGHFAAFLEPKMFLEELLNRARQFAPMNASAAEAART